MTQTTTNKSKFLRHSKCNNCGSSDGRAIYEDGSTYCFVCNTFEKQGTEAVDIDDTPSPLQATINLTDRQRDIHPLTDRGISQKTAHRYGVTATLNKEGEISHHHYPYFDRKSFKQIAVKTRNVSDKTFHFEGNGGNQCMLFGQQCFKQGGQYLTITEGECDAMAVYEIFGQKFPSVSIRSGSQGGVMDCKRNYEFINSFEKVVLCFDMDDPGQQSAREIAELFPPQKVSIVKMDLKDPNEYLFKNKRQEFIDRWYNAKVYTPDGIVLGEDTWDIVSKEDEIKSLPYPWEGMNKMTYGMRLGELCTFTAGSGIGKSSIMRELAYHIIKNTKESVGCLFLEESIERTAKGIMSVHGCKPFHLPTCQTTKEEKRLSWEQTLGTGRIRLWDHFGSTEISNIVSKVQYLASGLDCRYIILDHLSMVVSAMENGDERKAIDECMTKLRMLVQEQKIHLMLVSHLRRGTSDSGHEEGAVVSLSQLRGSAGIAQLSDMVFSLERNGQHDDEDIRNTTTIRVLKNRFSGETGPCCWLKWNKETGRMSECDAPVTRNNNRRNTKRKKNVVDDFQDMPTNGFKV